MKLSCLPISFFQALQAGTMGIGDWAAMARRCGMDAVDLSVLLIRNHAFRELAAVRRELDRAGLGVTMITTYPDFTHPDAVQRRRELDYLRRDIALASQLGALYLRITAGQAHPETSRANGVQYAVDGFRRAAEAADGYGVTLLFENHSQPGVWPHPDFSMPADVFLDIYTRTRDTRIKVNFDTGNPQVAGYDPLALLDEVIADVETVHVADNAEPGRLSPVVIGTGIAPLDAVFARLKRHGYDGWLCIEEASGTGEPGVKSAADCVRKLWGRSV